MKKNLKLLSISLLVLGNLAWADTDLVSSPDKSLIWSAAIVNNHSYMNQEACTAQIEARTNFGKKATLEMLALRDGVQYQQPTVMVRVEKVYSFFDFHNAEIRINT